MAEKATDESGGYHARALTRGITVLRTIAEARDSLTLADLHERTEIPKPTLVRLLSILTQEGCTVRVDEWPTYALGPTVSQIAAGITDSFDPEALAKPYLEDVAATLGHTANFGVLAGPEVVHLCVVLADRPIRYVARSGTRDSTHSTGLGKALLAQLSADDVTASVPSEPMEAKTANTITTRSRLDKELAQIRKQSYAYDAEEGAIGLCCFAVPFSFGEGKWAAVSVSGPTGELPKSAHATVVPALSKVAEQMSEDLRLRNALSAIVPALRTN